MAGNMRSKSGKRGSGVSEEDYKRARRQVLRESQICSLCGEAISLKLPAICRFIDTSTATVATVLPLYCTGDVPCDHQRKAQPFSASADHKIPVSQLPPGSPLLVDPKNLAAVHLVCNQLKGSGNGEVKPLYKTSKNHYQ